MADLELVKEELGRVYGLYGAQLRSFRRSLYGLIVVGLALFAVIVVPFLTFRDQLAKLQDVEAQLAVDRQAEAARLAAAEDDLESLADLNRQLRRFAEQQRSWGYHQKLAETARAHDAELADLRRRYRSSQDDGLAAWARGERAAPPEAAVASTRDLYGRGQRPCYWQSGVGYAACQVCEDFRDLDRSISGQIQRFSLAEAVTVTLPTPLVERACTWLAEGQPHWRTERPLDERDGARLRGLFSLDLRAYEIAQKEISQQLRVAVPPIRTEIERLERSQAITVEQLTALERQLNRIASFDRLGTPIGDLPIGLGQIVLLFPVALALAYVVLANSYARLAGLRAALARLSRKRDEAGEVMDQAHIAVIAPLWLDRSDAFGSRIVKIVILCLPLLLILANLFLIHDTRALAEQLPEDSALSPQIYLGLYALSLLLALGGLIHILRAAKR